MPITRSSIASAIKKGTSAVRAAYYQQIQAAEERSQRKIATARTRIEKERAKLELKREKVRLQRELAEARLALAREQDALAKTEASIKSSGSGFGKSITSGWKSLERWRHN